MPLAVQLVLSLTVLLLVAGSVTAMVLHPTRVRALTGLLVVLGGDAAIVLLAYWAAVRLGGLGQPAAIGVLTSAFTAVSTMTTAYLGIKAVSNTAQVLTEQPVGALEGEGGPPGAGGRPPAPGGEPPSPGSAPPSPGAEPPA
ncbi:hypothetical protein, partial [Streptomyces bambusae]|uniref:hypothetical protein n=1 Tax=Streptomyces bambusae TaxID=1550616 RepID=UPI001CA5300E